jgi:predicted TIM-barrel fold metal-dependent hydrolase
MIIDAHTHIGPNLTGYHHEDTECGEPYNLLSSMDKNDINKSIVFPTPVAGKYLVEVNGGIEKLYNVRLLHFTMIDPTNTADYCAKVGIKLHPVAHGYCLDHPICDPVFSYAKDNQLPVIVHSGWGEHGRMRYIEGRAKRSPGVNIIVAHMIEPDCLDIVKRSDNLYIDTSYAPTPNRIKLAVNMCGDHRVIFGSDWPSTDQGYELMKVQYAKI